jgi:hypothetical protein
MNQLLPFLKHVTSLKRNSSLLRLPVTALLFVLIDMCLLLVYMVLYECPFLFTGLYLVKVSAAVLMSVVLVSADTSTTDINNFSCSLVLCLVQVVVKVIYFCY